MSLEVGTVGGSWEKKTPEGAASREVALVTARAAGGGVQLRYNPRLPRTFQKGSGRVRAQSAIFGETMWPTG